MNIETKTFCRYKHENYHFREDDFEFVYGAGNEKEVYAALVDLQKTLAQKVFPHLYGTNWVEKHKIKFFTKRLIREAGDIFVSPKEYPVPPPEYLDSAWQKLTILCDRAKKTLPAIDKIQKDAAAEANSRQMYQSLKKIYE